MTGNCKNFSTRFTFTPESRKRRANRAVSGTSKKQYRHPLLLAQEFQELLGARVVNNRAEIARRYGLSRARVGQVMSLLSLPSEIQTYIAALPVEKQRLYSGRRLRQITALASESARAFEGLLKRLSGMVGP